MLTLRYARQPRAFLHPSSNAAAALLFSSLTTHPYSLSSSASYPFTPSSSPNPIASNGSQFEIPKKDIVDYFREWFMSRKKPLLDRVFEVLRAQDESSLNSSLTRFNLHVSETLVIDVLKYGNKDVLSCLKFFDWAGRQPGFFHTRVTFNAIFRILSKARLISLTLDFLQTYSTKRYLHTVRYQNVLVIGYAVAGKPETALELFGRMRFTGMDLDIFSYHVLLNSLVEHGYFDVVESLAREIGVQGLKNKVTHTLMVKCYCKQTNLERGLKYLYGLMQEDGAQLSGVTLATLFDALCKNNQYERAALLVEEFQTMVSDSLDPVYDVWIRNLVYAGNVDGALEFMKDKQVMEGYVPHVFRYNMLICRLLKENKMEQVYDLLVDMKEREIMLDDVTINAILCFLCKLGRMDIVLDLYESREELDLSVNHMAHDHLINALLWDGSIDEACCVLRNSIKEGYIPGQKTLSAIIDGLCQEGKIDKLKELVHFMLDHELIPGNMIYDKFITAFCDAGRAEEAYLVHGLLNKLNNKARAYSYKNLISGFVNSSRPDIAARLLIEMQEKGYRVSRMLIRKVVLCICKTNNPEYQLYNLLEMQFALHLARDKSPSTNIFNFFMSGADLAGKPELAFYVYRMMIKYGIEPNSDSEILLLHSYLNGGKIGHALHLFREWLKNKANGKLWHTMIVGLSRAHATEHASQILDDMKARNLMPSLECYEELIKAYCGLEQYHKAVGLVNDMTQIGRPLTSYIGNMFLLHSLKTKKVYSAWAYLSHKQNLTPTCWMLGHVIGIFSGAVEGNPEVEELEKLIQQCFHMDMYTHNMLLRRLSMNGMGGACKHFYRLYEKGYEPNRWTYDIVIHGLVKHGQISEARIWMEHMLRKRFDPSEATKRLISRRV